MQLGDFRWSRNKYGDYVVTYKRTGQSVLAIPIPSLERPKMYRIAESDETTLDSDGRVIPKAYDFWGVMSFCSNRKPGAKIDTPTREGLSHA